MEKSIITVEDSGDERDIKHEKNQKQSSMAGLGILCPKFWPNSESDVFSRKCKLLRVFMYLHIFHSTTTVCPFTTIILENTMNHISVKIWKFYFFTFSKADFFVVWIMTMDEKFQNQL